MRQPTKKTAKQQSTSTPAPVAAPIRGALDVNAACIFLSCSRNTLYRLMAAGELKPIYIRPRKPVLRVADLEAFLTAAAELSA